MPFKCRQCPTRTFVSRIALSQHQRQTAGHPFCSECDQYFDDYEKLEAHKDNTHASFPCTTCNTSFMTQMSLEDHYRGKIDSIHPTCSRCAKGFFNLQALNEHKKTDHPVLKCHCGSQFHKEELDLHYIHSPMHPTCLLCGIGFETDASYDEHAAAEHSDRRCTACRRQFPTPEELKDHFALSSDHPTCKKCELGFLDDAALHEHDATEHPAPPRVLSAPEMPIRDAFTLEGVAAASRANQALLPPPGKEQSEWWNQTKNKVVSPFETGLTTALVRSASHPTWTETAARLSKTTWGCGLGVGGTTEASSLSVVPARSSCREPDTPRIKAILNTPQQFEHDGVSRRRDWQATPRPSVSGSPTVHSSGVKLSDKSGITTPFAVPSANAMYTRGKTISPQSSTSSLYSESYAELSEGSSGTDPGRTRRGPDSLATATSNGTVVAPTAVDLECSLCRRAPFVEPTATICGHIFCNKCIMKQIMQTSKCPKCATPTLLYCLFRLHMYSH
ncbi:hypothetical protein DFH09DRAFT_132349 [Mycena vulgaris]|nr:hypothetical protein DFH09DRAFT_132349 [Mycena vulgaris]